MAMRMALFRFSTLPRDFADLRAAAEGEGYHFLGRLEERWQDNKYLDDAQATVCGAVNSSSVIAIGAQTFDEYDPSPLHRRIRHFYVRPDVRRNGVGRRLAEILIEDALAIAPVLHLRATHALSTAFWGSMGFARVEGREDRTHVLHRSAGRSVAVA